jgi:hypothetical protein
VVAEHKLKIRTGVVAAHKTKELFDMFKLSETSSQGYQVVIKPKTKLLGGSSATINEQKNKALFDMFGLRL